MRHAVHHPTSSYDGKHIYRLRTPLTANDPDWSIDPEPAQPLAQLHPAHRDHGESVSFNSRHCSSHGRKIVDLYIYEQFGQLLVTVGQFANQIAEFGLLKMLRSRCFATIVQRAISRTAHCSRNTTRSCRLLWNECAQLTLISARDYNVADASRTVSARF